MGFGRLPGEAVDRKQVLRARRESDHTVELGFQDDVVARLRLRLLEREPAVLRPRNVHEEVEGARGLWRGETEFVQPRREIIGAVVVVGSAAQTLIAVGVASGYQGVV